MSKRRYGIAAYLTQTQRERAAGVEYRTVFALDGVLMTRAVEYPNLCPLAVALDMSVSPTPDAVEYALSKTGSNQKIRSAARRFIHAVDTGLIRPHGVAAALGVKP